MPTKRTFSGFNDKDYADALVSGLAHMAIDSEEFEHNGWYFVGWVRSDLGAAVRAGVIACCAGKCQYFLTGADPRKKGTS